MLSFESDFGLKFLLCTYPYIHVVSYIMVFFYYSDSTWVFFTRELLEEVQQGKYWVTYLKSGYFHCFKVFADWMDRCRTAHSNVNLSMYLTAWGISFGTWKFEPDQRLPKKLLKITHLTQISRKTLSKILRAKTIALL